MPTDSANKVDWFVKARFGLFIHYGLYSMLGRGEWALNREHMGLDEYRKLAEKFNPVRFDADRFCSLALESGMKYINLTTMHHDGFRLYDTELSDFNCKRFCGRDLVEELVTAARKHGLRIALYHSLNNWMDQPDSVAALESKDAYEEFIGNTHARIKELVTRFNPIDVMWYDGWWPFNAEGWQAEKMNAMVREIQPHILFNPRNCLDGDFSTPEGHLTAPTPWRPWEACITFNEHWGWHRHDNEWKSPESIIALLCRAAAQKGNLLFNVGPQPDGSVPQPCVDILKSVGEWIKTNAEAIFDTDLFTMGLEKREAHHRSDHTHHGPFTGKGKNLYQILRFWPGTECVISGFTSKVKEARLLCDKEPLQFVQDGPKVTVTGLPEAAPERCPVLRFTCEEAAELYWTGGMRIPAVPHPPYDPAPSDIGN